MKSSLLHLRLLISSLAIIVASAVAAFAQTIGFTSSPYPAGADKAPATIGVAYIYGAQAEASNGGKVRYALRFGPSGMDVHERTGVVSWQPSGEGEFDAEIRAELVDNPSINTTQTWKIAVSKVQNHPGCTGNETWLTVGAGLPGVVISMASTGDELYALHVPEPYENSHYRLSKWNGKYWTILSDRAVPDDILDWEHHLISFNGEIYRYANHPTLPWLSSPEAIARWDGSAWARVGESNFTQVTDAILFDDALYVLGVRMIDQTEQYILAKWDGTNWQTIRWEWEDWGVAMATLNGKLYIACNVGAYHFHWTELPIVELHNDGTVEPVKNRNLGRTEINTIDLIAHNGALIVINGFGGGSHYRWDGTKVEKITPPRIGDRSYSFRDKGVISFDNQLYIAIWAMEGQLPFVGDYKIWRLNDDGWQPVTGPQVLVTKYPTNSRFRFFEHKGELFGAGNFDQSCGINLRNVAVLGTGGDCAQVSGSVYHDDDRSCAMESGERMLANELVEILPGPLYALTGTAGTFTTLLQPGTYTLSVVPKRNWTNPCLISPEITLASAAAAVGDVNIGTDGIPGIYDVRSSLASGLLRPGFDVTYTLTYWNSGTELATGKIIFEHDNRLAYRTASTVPNRQNGNRLEWDFENLPVGASVTITITLNVPPSIQMGTEICASVEVQLERKDDEEFLDDNRDEICTIVRGSFDPNDIRVSPVRYDVEFGDAPLLPGDTVLSYLVRFQNTGTDTAFTVVVSDTLDPPLLDITSLRLGAASHDFDFNISGTGILTWTFNNILLPDSNVNELASHGYFKYTVHLRRGLAPLTQIPNRASIYFDYNAPVMTNTVVSITSGTLSVVDEESASASLQIYPNPVRGTSAITLNLIEREHVKLRLIDSRGDVIAILNDKEMSAGEHMLSFDARELSSGAYYLVLDRGGVKEIYPVVVEE